LKVTRRSQLGLDAGVWASSLRPQDDDVLQQIICRDLEDGGEALELLTGGDETAVFGERKDRLWHVGDNFDRLLADFMMGSSELEAFDRAHAITNAFRHCRREEGYLVSAQQSGIRAKSLGNWTDTAQQ
jgi:hypothetical protein